MLGHVVLSLLWEMRAHQDQYVETVEKPYGTPWADQFRLIQRDAFGAWCDVLQERWIGAGPQDRMAALASIVHMGSAYTRIEPVEPAEGS